MKKMRVDKKLYRKIHKFLIMHDLLRNKTELELKHVAIDLMESVFKKTA